MKKVAVVLSGSGFLDGSEITEAISTLLVLSETGCETSYYAPNINVPSMNHQTQTPDGERNVLAESARITRGQIHDLKTLKEKEYDAIIFPGGFGAAKNLSSWATEGANCKVHPEVTRVITEFHKSMKPIGAMCIAPTLVAKVLGSEGVNLTIGSDLATSKEIEKTGAHHVKCEVTDYVSDRDHKVITTPAYMCDAKPHEIYTGIRKMILELVEMA